LIHQVTTLVSGVSVLILDVAFIVLKNDNVTLIIAVEISKNITLIEVPLVHVRGNVDGLGLVSEVLKRLFTHLNKRSVDLSLNFVRLDDSLNYSFNYFNGLLSLKFNGLLNSLNLSGLL